MKLRYDPPAFLEVGIIIIFLFFLTLGYFWPLLIENKHIIAEEALLLKYLAELNSYPVNILLNYLVGRENVDIILRLIDFSVMLHYLVAALSMYYLARVGFKANKYGALLSGIVFAYVGMQISYSSDIKTAYATAWFPLFYLFFKEWTVKSYIAELIFVVISLLLILLAGDNILSLSILTFAVSMSLFNTTPVKRYGLACLILLGILLLGIIGYLSFFKNLFVGINPLSLLNFLLYFVFPQHTFPNWWLYTIYIGIIPLVFIPIGIYVVKYYNLLDFKATINAFLLTLFVLLLISHLKQESHIIYLSEARVIIYLILSILVGIGCTVFMRAMCRAEKSFFHMYSIFLRKLTLFILLIIVPIVYGSVVFAVKKNWHLPIIIPTADSIIFALIFLITITIIFNLRLINKGRKYFFIILFLTIIDIFTFYNFRILQTIFSHSR